MLLELGVVAALAGLGHYMIRRERSLQATLAQEEAVHHHRMHRIESDELERLVFELWVDDEEYLGPPWQRLKSEHAFCAAAHLAQMDTVDAQRLLLRVVDRYVIPRGLSGKRFLSWRAESLTPLALGKNRYRGLEADDLRRQIERLWSQ
jgi:hypothetical protein